jgi:molecular chaperone DnaJ
MKNKCYYEILEISSSADKTTIKRAYKKMAMKYHPDKNLGNNEAEENFKYVNEAYQVLNNEQTRSIYDRGGKEAVAGANQGGGGGFSGFGDISDIFNDFFGGGGTQKRTKPNYGYDLDAMIELSISFEEAVFGCSKTLEYAYKSACNSCKGNGAKDGIVQTCEHCQGSGNIAIGGGFINIAQTCPYCKGAGGVATSRCGDCSGVGSKNNKATFDIKIPAGIDTDNQMRVGEKGNKAPNGDRGELYVNIKVAKHKYFLRDEDDIYFQAPILFTKAILGGKITIPSLKGEMELNIPINTKDKERFTFKGQGVKNVNHNHKGNFIVQVEITYPKKLNIEQKQLLKQLQESFKQNSYNNDDILSKIKSWF